MTNQNPFYSAEVTNTLPAVGLRVIRHLNPDMKKSSVVLSDDCDLSRGGFSAAIESDPYPFGDRVTIPHAKENEECIAACKLRDVAILKMDSPNEKRWEAALYQNDEWQFSRRISDIIPPMMRGSKDNGWKPTAYGYVFLVFLNDPDLNVHALRIKGTATAKALVNIANGMFSGLSKARMALAAANGGEIPPKLQMYALRCNLIAGKPEESKGANGTSGMITPVFVDVANMKQENIASRIVTPEQYLMLSQKAALLNQELEDFDPSMTFAQILDSYQNRSNGLQLAAPAE